MKAKKVCPALPLVRATDTQQPPTPRSQPPPPFSGDILRITLSPNRTLNLNPSSKPGQTWGNVSTTVAQILKILVTKAAIPPRILMRCSAEVKQAILYLKYSKAISLKDIICCLYVENRFDLCRRVSTVL